MAFVARFRLPLFPLPVVLFPTEAMPLHIFEPRYRRMVARCLETDRRFGLVYHDADLHGPFLMEQGRVGCVAEIGEFELLPDGRSLLIAHGAERFVVRDGIESEEPFYEALVSAYEDRAPDPDLARRRDRSLTLFRQVVASLGEEPRGLPALDPSQELSFRLVRTIEVAPAWKQAFLELRDEAQRLERLDSVFQAALR